MLRKSIYKYIFGAAALAASFSATGSEIQKCIINGKTVYSNNGCGGGFASKVVVIQHAAGVVSPARATIDDTLEHTRPQRWVDEQPGRSATRTNVRNGQTHSNSYDSPLPVRTSMPVANRKSLCESQGKYIESLDAMARQPQSARNRDWIKGERAKTGSAMYDAKC